MDPKLKHLEFIQKTINRMASNSFLLRGWTVTLAGALLALSFKETNNIYVVISLGVLIVFWLLDSYYLWQERLFIRLFNHVRVLPDSEINFAMDTAAFQKGLGWFDCTRSLTELIFYGGTCLHSIILL